MGKFLPYEMRIILPYRYKEPSTWNGGSGEAWGLPSRMKIIRAQDPYMLAHKTWLRVKEIRDIRGTLEWMCVEVFAYKRGQGPHDFTMDRIARGMMPPSSYNNHMSTRPSNVETIPWDSLASSPLRDLCSYASDQKIHINITRETEYLSVCFWMGTFNMTLFIRDGHEFFLWTPHGGLLKLSDLQDVFTQGIAELRSFSPS